MSLLKGRIRNLYIGKSLFQMLPYLVWCLWLPINARDQIHCIDEENAKLVDIGGMVLVPLINKFPMLGGNLDGQFSPLFSLLTSEGEVIAQDGEAAAENSRSAAPDKGSIQSDVRGISWHFNNMVLLAGFSVTRRGRY